MNQLKGYYMPRKRTGNPPGKPNIVWRKAPTEQITFPIPPSVKRAWKDPEYNYMIKKFMEDEAEKLDEKQ